MSPAPFQRPMQRHRNNLPPLTRSVVLVGMMGVGKSTIGRRLARRLNIEFIDSDDAIEMAQGRSIAHIFATDGEEYFRRKEREIIAELLALSPRIIATGGGAFVQPETHGLIKERGTSLWLDAPIDVLWERVNRRPHRPLLATANPRATFESLYETRRAYYADADLRIESGDGPHGIVVTRIIEALQAKP